MREGLCLLAGALGLIAAAPAPDALAVERGQAVTIVYRTGALEIRAPGRAMSSGPTGATVRVFNEASRRTQHGLVVAAGLVAIKGNRR